MEKLFNDSELFQPQRPTEKDITEEQKEAFYKKIATEIINNGYSQEDEVSIIDAIKSIYDLDDSGYEIAKRLEDSYCDFDFSVSFIEYLDCIGSEYRDITRRNIKDWVAAIKPIPKLELAQEVRFPKPLYTKMDVSLPYFITKINTEDATYCINSDKDKYGGYIFPYEKIESLNINNADTNT